MPKRLLSLTLLFLGTASCGPADNDPGPGGVNTSDARALDEAAQKLDIEQNKLPETSPAE
jgi:hypothetical protein